MCIRDSSKNAAYIPPAFGSPTSYTLNAGDVYKRQEQYLKDNPGVARIVLCLDNDTPGRAASAAIQKKLSEYEVIDNPPRSGKDYNDQLRLVKGISGRVRTRGGDAR